MRKDHLVARLVAMAWCDGYSPSMTVNHIDGDYRNNAAANLEWLTLADNIRRGVFRSEVMAHGKKLCCTPL